MESLIATNFCANLEWFFFCINRLLNFPSPHFEFVGLWCFGQICWRFILPSKRVNWSRHYFSCLCSRCRKCEKGLSSYTRLFFFSRLRRPKESLSCRVTDAKMVYWSRLSKGETRETGGFLKHPTQCVMRSSNQTIQVAVQTNSTSYGCLCLFSLNEEAVFLPAETANVLLSSRMVGRGSTKRKRSHKQNLVEDCVFKKFSTLVSPARMFALRHPRQNTAGIMLKMKWQGAVAHHNGPVVPSSTLNRAQFQEEQKNIVDKLEWYLWVEQTSLQVLL